MYVISDDQVDLITNLFDSYQGGGTVVSSSPNYTAREGQRVTELVPAGGRDTTIPTGERDEELARLEIAILSLIFALDIVGNGIVTIVLRSLSRSKKLSRMNAMIAHLTGADFFVGLFNVLPMLAWKVTFRFQGGAFLCKFVTYMQLVAMFASSYVLVTTAIDRYVAICHPLKMHTWNVGRMHVLVAIAWFLAFLFSLPQLLIFSFTADTSSPLLSANAALDGANTTSGLDSTTNMATDTVLVPVRYNCLTRFEPEYMLTIYITWVTFAIYVIPLLILIIVYANICLAVWRSVSFKDKRARTSRGDCSSSTSSYVSTSISVSLTGGGIGGTSGGSYAGRTAVGRTSGGRLRFASAEEAGYEEDGVSTVGAGYTGVIMNGGRGGGRGRNSVGYGSILAGSVYRGSYDDCDEEEEEMTHGEVVKKKQPRSSTYISNATKDRSTSQGGVTSGVDSNRHVVTLDDATASSLSDRQRVVDCCQGGVNHTFNSSTDCLFAAKRRRRPGVPVSDQIVSLATPSECTNIATIITGQGREEKFRNADRGLGGKSCTHSTVNSAPRADSKRYCMSPPVGSDILPCTGPHTVKADGGGGSNAVGGGVCDDVWNSGRGWRGRRGEGMDRGWGEDEREEPRRFCSHSVSAEEFDVERNVDFIDDVDDCFMTSMKLDDDALVDDELSGSAEPTKCSNKDHNKSSSSQFSPSTYSSYQPPLSNQPNYVTSSQLNSSEVNPSRVNSAHSASSQRESSRYIRQTSRDLNPTNPVRARHNSTPTDYMTSGGDAPRTNQEKDYNLTCRHNLLAIESDTSTTRVLIPEEEDGFAVETGGSRNHAAVVEGLDDVGDQSAAVSAAAALVPLGGVPRAHGVRAMSTAKLRTVKLTLVVIASYVICYGPFFVSQMWAAWDEEAPFQGQEMAIIMLLASLNSCTNPWIYLSFNGHVPRQLRRCLGRLTGGKIGGRPADRRGRTARATVGGGQRGAQTYRRAGGVTQGAGGGGRASEYSRFESVTAAAASWANQY